VHILGRAMCVNLTVGIMLSPFIHRSIRQVIKFTDEVSNYTVNCRAVLCMPVSNGDFNTYSR
jgi:hypothetical protein